MSRRAGKLSGLGEGRITSELKQWTKLFAFEKIPISRKLQPVRLFVLGDWLIATLETSLIMRHLWRDLVAVREIKKKNTTLEK